MGLRVAHACAGDVPQKDGFSERWSVTRDSFTPPEVPENLLFHHGSGE